MKNYLRAVIALAIVVLCAMLSSTAIAGMPKGKADLAGAWRGKVQMNSGDFAPFKDLEFLYSFNLGGTMTESSNYDAMPPGPPAYGVWRKIGPMKFEAKYVVWMTRADSIMDKIRKGAGWVPDGYGVLTEVITMAENGDSYGATLKFEIFDAQDKLTTRGGEGVVKAKRIKF